MSDYLYTHPYISVMVLRLFGHGLPPACLTPIRGTPGDGILSLAEFKAGTVLVDPSIPMEEAEAEYARMDAQDEGEEEVRFDSFCAWLARRSLGAATTVQEDIGKLQEYSMRMALI